MALVSPCRVYRELQRPGIDPEAAFTTGSYRLVYSAGAAYLAYAID